MTSTENMELRAVIKFCEDLGHTPTQTHQLMQKSNRKCSRELVYKWHRRFREGRTSLEDDVRSGRPDTVRQRMVARVSDCMEKDRRLTVRAIADDIGTSYGTVERILTQDLNMTKVSARWVPRLLSTDHKENRVACSMEFLRRYDREGDAFLDRIITQDETWLHHYDPESKRQSSVWKTPRTPPPKKARVTRSSGKHMFVFFMDRRGMILIHQVPDGQTINAAYYCKVLSQHLVRALHRKRPGMDTHDFILHQDNAPSHTAAATQLEIDVLGFQRISHPPYSPDLAPMDFRVFPEVKEQLRGIHFDTAEQLTKEAQTIVSRFDAGWYRDTYDKWVSRHRKCLRINGDYIEKVDNV